MKKLLLILTLICAGVFSTSANENEYSPEKGEFAIEVQFNPFATDFNTFKLEKLEGRYFISNKTALRLGVGFGFDKDKVTPYSEESLETWDSEISKSFSLGFGLEQHVYNYKRIDLYVGGAFEYAGKFDTKTNSAQYRYDTTVKKSYHETHEFSINGLTGINFFLYKGLYIGTELGVKFAFETIPSGTYEFPNSDSGNLKSLEEPEIRRISLKPYIEPTLHIGWSF